MDSTSGKILRRLLREGRVSRAELAEGLGISRAAVSAVTDHLMGEGLIRVSGIGESRGGKPPVMLSIEPDAFHVIGLDIGSGTLLRGLRWNAAGETVQQVELPFRNTFEEILEKSAHLIQKLVGRDSCVRVAGICAAVSGIVDREKNEVHLSANFPLAGKHFADCLGEKCGYEILLENRSRVSAECERYFGAAKGCGDFLFVTAEKSIGSTLYSNGRLFQGWNGAAGEIRSIPVLVDGMLMPLEKALDESRILRSAGTRYHSEEELFSAFEKGDVEADSVCRGILEASAGGIAVAVNLTDPELVILGGRFRSFGERFLREFREGLERLAPSVYGKRRVVYSAVGRDGALKGAALAALLKQTENMRSLTTSEGRKISRRKDHNT